jgi:membrane protein implicated in regulation of membrane protease activity
VTRHSNLFTIKTAAFGLALAAGISGMALALRWLVWAAVGLLATAFLLRFVRRSGLEATGPDDQGVD